jgi:hypothetical protein
MQAGFHAEFMQSFTTPSADFRPDFSGCQKLLTDALKIIVYDTTDDYSGLLPFDDR